MYALGIDLGTTFTAAAVWRDGRAEISSLGSRAAAIPSVVVLREDETIITGETAQRRALTSPHRVAREFKRRLGDSTPILLGGVPYSAEALMARVLSAVVDEVSAREGGAPDLVCVSHPANWGPFKTDLLQQAVRRANLDSARFTVEPAAAALFYAHQQRIPDDAVIAVYDLGGGTFDAAVLRKNTDGFEILGRPEGIERLGGIDFDAAVYAHVARALGGALEELDDEDPAAIAAVARLKDECTQAKEALSADTDTTIPVLLPNLSTEVRLTRAELESMVRPALQDTIDALRRALRSAGISPEELHSVLLVGGSSRMPIVSQLITADLGRPVSVDAHPKHAVALGAALVAGAALTAQNEPASASPAPAPAPGAAAVGAAAASAPAAPATPVRTPRPGRPAPTASSSRADSASPAGPATTGRTPRPGSPALASPASGAAASPAAGALGAAAAAAAGAASAAAAAPGSVAPVASATSASTPDRPAQAAASSPAPASSPATPATPANPATSSQGRSAAPANPASANPASANRGSADPAASASTHSAAGAPAQDDPFPFPAASARQSARPAPPTETTPAIQETQVFPAVSSRPGNRSRPIGNQPRPTGNQPRLTGIPAHPNGSAHNRPDGPQRRPARTRVLALSAAGAVAAIALGAAGVAALQNKGDDKTDALVKKDVVAATSTAAPTKAGGVVGGAPADEQCTDEIKANPRWVCLTSASFEGDTLTIRYKANFAGAEPNVRGGYHLHIYGGDGVTPAAEDEGRQSMNPGQWYVEDEKPSVRKASSDDFKKAIGDAPKVCARIATAAHILVPDKNGTYVTGNCVPINRDRFSGSKSSTKSGSSGGSKATSTQTSTPTPTETPTETPTPTWTPTDLTISPASVPTTTVGP